MIEDLEITHKPFASNVASKIPIITNFCQLKSIKKSHGQAQSRTRV